MEDLNDNLDAYQENNKAVFLAKFHLSETGIARCIKVLVNSAKSVRTIDSLKAIDWVQGQLAITLAEKQIEAVRRAIENKVAFIPGSKFYPKGTVKTNEMRLNFSYATEELINEGVQRLAQLL